MAASAAMVRMRDSSPGRYNANTYKNISTNGVMNKYAVPEEVKAALAMAAQSESAGSEGALDGEQLLLDENAEAEGGEHDYYDVGAVQPSPSHNLLAFSVDTSGYETYSISVRHAAPGARIQEQDSSISSSNSSSSDGVVDGDALVDFIPESDGSVVWGSGDDSDLFYMKQDDQHRPFQVWRHIINTKGSQHVGICREAEEGKRRGKGEGNGEEDGSGGFEKPGSDQLLFQEDDGMFWVNCEKSDSGRFLFIESSSTETSEWWAVDLEEAAAAAAAAAPEGGETGSSQTFPTGAIKCVCIKKRQAGVRCTISHQGAHFYLLSNQEGCLNSKLLRAPVDWVLSGSPSGLLSRGRKVATQLS
jgi:oligopeptidase B